MSVCDGSCVPSCSYGCELRKKNLLIAPSAMPTRMNNVPPPKANPVWERQIITDKRPDGSEMPIFRPGTTTPLRIKEYSERKREIDSGLKRLKNS